ncbi:MAG: hypothetical protein N838_09735 [Thiohalocapsa sp. PB-PSB1]|jgi:hypothetical protein|nr:MAG: hypothetical protein N838_06550 [Thiohalocapsa sp. PB-PSB1]QQO53591.1 MAG: hypothetical protein N838_09735 [Thiohalocapsa sp. PB-PSB1]HCS92346.1 hypothetical protein [Chromatiaceae bacterium]
MPEIKPEIDLEHGQEPELDLLMIVSTTEADSVLLPLAGACARRGLRWTCFFSGDGVQVLDNPAVVQMIGDADQPVACEHSWAGRMGAKSCPITLGSQTDNSALVGRASTVIGL